MRGRRGVKPKPSNVRVRRRQARRGVSFKGLTSHTLIDSIHLFVMYIKREIERDLHVYMHIIFNIERIYYIHSIICNLFIY